MRIFRLNFNQHISAVLEIGFNCKKVSDEWGHFLASFLEISTLFERDAHNMRLVFWHLSNMVITIKMCKSQRRRVAVYVMMWWSFMIRFNDLRSAAVVKFQLCKQELRLFFFPKIQILELQGQCWKKLYCNTSQLMEYFPFFSKIDYEMNNFPFNHYSSLFVGFSKTRFSFQVSQSRISSNRSWTLDKNFWNLANHFQEKQAYNK